MTTATIAPTAPSMSAADVAAHEAASYVRRVPSSREFKDAYKERDAQLAADLRADLRARNELRSRDDDIVWGR